MILGRDIPTELVFNFKLSDHVIEADDGPFKESTTPMVDLVTYEFKDLNTGKLHPKNHLQILKSKKYMTWNMSVIPLNYYV